MAEETDAMDVIELTDGRRTIDVRVDGGVAVVDVLVDDEDVVAGDVQMSSFFNEFNIEYRLCRSADCMSRIMARLRRGTRLSNSGSDPTGTSINLHGTITVSSILATAREKRSIANTTLCCENSDTELSNDIVFLNVEFLRLGAVSMVTGGVSWLEEMALVRRIISSREKSSEVCN